MIKCIAIDDEPLALEQLVGYISRVPFLQLIASCEDALVPCRCFLKKKST